MAIANPEWWNRAAIPARPEISISDRLKQAVELMAANIGQAIGRLANPPYPTSDGKPLKVVFYDGPNSPQSFMPEQIKQLAAITEMFSGKNLK